MPEAVAAARRLCGDFFKGHLALRPLEGTALGLAECDGSLEDLSPSGLARQRAFYRDLLNRTVSFRGRLPLAERLDLDKVASLCRFNLHLLDREHPVMLEHALEVQEGLAVQTLRAKGESWRAVASRLERVPAFLWQLAENARRAQADGLRFDRRTAADLRGQTPEIAGFIESLPEKGGKALEGPAARAASAYRDFGSFLNAFIVPKGTTAFALGEAEYGWRMREGLWSREGLGTIQDWGRRRLAEIQREMRELAARIEPRADMRALMHRLGAPYPRTDAQAIGSYRRLSERARDFVRAKELFELPPAYRLEVIPAPPGMGEAITTAAYFPAPPFDRKAKGYFIVAVGRGNRERLKAHNPLHAASTAVHEAFPGHDLQYCWWQAKGDGIPAVRYLRGDPRNWGDSMNAEGYAHYTEDLMRLHGFYTPQEELFQLAAQAWRAARIVVDIGLHAGGMSRERAAVYLEREAFLPKPVAEGESFRYSKWPTQAVTYALGRRSIERLKDRCRALWGARFGEARFHTWFLSFGPLPPDAIASALEP